MEKNSFVLYDEYAEQFSLLSLEQRGVLITAIFAYRRNDEMPDMDGAVKMAFSFIKAQLTRDSERYEDICGKRRAAGATGGAPKGNQNAKKQENISVLPNNQNKQMLENKNKNNQNKQKQAKQPDNDNVNDNVNDNEKEKGTYVPKKKEDERTDGQDDENNEKVEKTLDFDGDRAKRQKEFFQLYPNVVVDNYSASDYADVDFEVLILRFEESAFLRSTNSFAWICKNWRKIAVGEYRDFERRFERQERHSQSKSKLGSEWDDLD